MKTAVLFVIISVLSSLTLYAQEKGIFVERQKGYWEEIEKNISDFEKKDKPLRKSFKVDFSKIDLPKSVSEFQSYWHNEPLSQGNTGTCWSFSTTSFLESEAFRLHNKKVKLSEVYTAYWEYVEKTKRYIQERGNSFLGQGSEANAVTRIWKKYGIVPADVYTGMKDGQKYHNHSKMFKEIESYLNTVKQNNEWDEETAVNTVKSIMNYYIGEPPAEFSVDGVIYTPEGYLKNYLQINPDEYVDILSIKQQPYWKQVVYEVQDNWWNSAEYYNVPLNDFMNAIKSAVRNGYTMAIGGDVSEPGVDGWHDAAIVPAFDIPSEYINDDARQFRFSNETTTDDHGIHLIGYMEKDGKDWYLIKDSGAGAMNGNNKGYYFYHEDYVKLKMMDFMVHKDAVKDLLKKFSE